MPRKKLQEPEVSSKKATARGITAAHRPKKTLAAAAAASSPSPSPATLPPAPDPDELREEIAQLAYSIWQERGCPEGSDVDDWVRAETEVLSRYK